MSVATDVLVRDERGNMFWREMSVATDALAAGTGWCGDCDSSREVRAENMPKEGDDHLRDE